MTGESGSLWAWFPFCSMVKESMGFAVPAQDELLRTVDTETITLQFAGQTIRDCVSLIIVPEIAVAEPGYIKTLTIKAAAHAKHEFQAMAQMAYFQFQDDELEITPLQESLCITFRGETEYLAAGMALYRNTAGHFHALIHDGQNRKKILEAAHRFCTRWVRLDI